MNKHCLLIGGDNRHKYLSKLLIEQGYTVYCLGMERCIHLPEQAILTQQIPHEASLIILPLPITKDEKNIFAPYSDSPLPIAPLFKEIKQHQLVCGGIFHNEMKHILQQNETTYFDYAANEQFAINNAIPSAEGAIELAMHNTSHTLCNSSVCVVGYGKIGKALVSRLLGLGCIVTATARKKRDLQEIERVGATALPTAMLHQAESFDIIFNTVPAMVLDSSVLEKQKSTVLLIDLASKPGGTDFNYAYKRNMRYIHALSLPAICAPQTAAQNIWRSIQQYINLEEEKQ
ncbi:MAG: NAD(P)-binding domain-containing protein [Clostridia bacterium]|nr:NAD(P)-binding domain-containing protein [Clostridia bacterium]